MTCPRLAAALAAALALGAAAGPAAQPAVEWAYLGPDSAMVYGFALVDPADGRPYGLPDGPFATFSFPNTEQQDPYETGVYRLDDPRGGGVPPDSAAAWVLTTSRTTFARGLYADPAGLALAASGSGPAPLTRSTDGGRTWATVEADRACGTGSSEHQIVRTYGPGRERALWIVHGLCRSDDEGATWAPVMEEAPSFVSRFDLLELPPSAALPAGRLVMGVGSGVLVSDDSGRTWAASDLYGGFRWAAHDLELAPDPTHPYGGTAYVIASDFYADGGRMTVLASDDGGASWTLRHRFLDGEHGLQTIGGDAQLEVLGDGSLVAALMGSSLGMVPIRWSGAVVWSGSGGRRWEPLGPPSPALDGGPVRGDPTDGACGPPPGACPGGAWPGWAPVRLEVDREGRVWAGTHNGVWRTTGPTWASVDGERGSEPGAAAVSVRPNPAAGRLEVVASGPWRGPVRVAVFDALGRRVAEAEAVGGRAAFETGGWAPGAYVVRATGPDGAAATASLAVVR